METRVTGRVKFYNVAKGFGFAVMAGEGKDVFIHGSQLQAEWTPKTDEPISFELERHERGLRAKAVQPATG